MDLTQAGNKQAIGIRDEMLQEDTSHQMGAKDNKCGGARESGKYKNIKQMIMERKLSFFGHVCRMGNDRLVKQVIFGMMDGRGVRGSSGVTKGFSARGQGLTTAPLLIFLMTLFVLV